MTVTLVSMPGLSPQKFLFCLCFLSSSKRWRESAAHDTVGTACVQAQVHTGVNTCACAQAGRGGVLAAASPQAQHTQLCWQHTALLATRPAGPGKVGPSYGQVCCNFPSLQKQILSKHLLPLWKKVTILSENQTVVWKKSFLKPFKYRFVHCTQWAFFLCMAGNTDVQDICMGCLFAECHSHGRAGSTMAGSSRMLPGVAGMGYAVAHAQLLKSESTAHASLPSLTALLLGAPLRNGNYLSPFSGPVTQ